MDLRSLVGVPVFDDDDGDLIGHVVGFWYRHGRLHLNIDYEHPGNGGTEDDPDPVRKPKSGTIVDLKAKTKSG